MKDNRFHENRKELYAICLEQNVDISVGCSMLAKEKGWKEYGKEEREFKLHVNNIPAEEREAYFTN